VYSRVSPGTNIPGLETSITDINGWRLAALPTVNAEPLLAAVIVPMLELTEA